MKIIELLKNTSIPYDVAEVYQFPQNPDTNPFENLKRRKHWKLDQKVQKWTTLNRKQYIGYTGEDWIYPCEYTLMMIWT